MGTPTVTIILPGYTLETVNSLIDQVHSDFSCIVVNDIDPHILDSRFTFIQTDSVNLSNRLNLGFQSSHTIYETWFEPDGFINPYCLIQMYMYMEHVPTCDFLYTGCDIINEDGYTHSIINDVVTQRFDAERLRSQNFLGGVWLWKRALRLKAGPYIDDPDPQWIMCQRMVDAGGKFQFLENNLGTLRRKG